MTTTSPQRFLSRTIPLLFAISFLTVAVRAQLLVTNDDASGSGSLLSAVDQPGNNAGSQIQFSGIDGNITLGSPLNITNGLTINALTTTALTIPDAIVLSGPLTFNMSGVSGTVSGAITDGSSPGSLLVQDTIGGGTLILSGSNGYTGGTSMTSNVTLGITNNSSLGTGALTFNGGTLQTQQALGNFSNAVTLTGAGVVDLFGNASTFSGAVTGGGLLTITDSSSGGGGALTLTGANSLSGGIDISAGSGAGGVSVVAGALGALGSGRVSMTGGTSQANLDLAGFAETIGSLTGDSASTLDLNGAALNVGADGTNTSFAGIIKDSAGTGVLTKTGGGTLSLSGANTYAGGTNLTAGTLGISNNSSLGTGALTISAGATLLTQGALTNFSNAVTLGGAATIALDGNSSTFSGPITGSGALTVTNVGVLTLSGANSYAGGTTVNSGATVGIVNSGALGTGALTLNGGGLQTQASLAGGGSFGTAITLNGAATVDVDGNSSTFSGPISGSGALNVSNSNAGTNGILTLTGGNSYSGGTTINTGATVGVGNIGALGTGALTFNGGALQTQLGISGGAFGGAVTLAGAGTVDVDGNASTISGAIGGAGALTITDSSAGGGGTLALTGANTNSGGITIAAGIGAGGINVLANAAGALGDGRVTMTGGTSQSNLNLAGFAETIGSLSGDAASTLDLNGASLNVGGDGTSATFAGLVKDSAGTGVLSMSGAGTLVLSGVNTYAGGTNLAAGTLGAANDSSLGTGAVTFNGGTLQTSQALSNFSNAVTLARAGTLDLDGNASTFSGAITGAGRLTITDGSSGGGGALTLTGANTNTGGIDIAAGTGAGGVGVLADAPGSLGSGRVAMTGGAGQASLNLEGFAETIGSLSANANAALDLDGAALAMGGDGSNTSFAGTIQDSAGTGALIKTGGGTFVLSGTWNNAATEVAGGTFQLGVNTRYTGTLTVDSGGTFDLNGFGQTGTGAVLNNGTIKTGVGTLTAASYSGGGLLSVGLQNSGAALNVAGNANVAGGTLLVSNHPAAGAYTVVNAGTLSGQFSSIELSPDFRETAAYSGGKLTLTLVPTLASGAQSPNQRAVGTALFNISGSATGDLRAALNQLDALAPASANAALDQAGPRSMVAMGAMEFSASSLQASAVSRHLTDLAVGGAEPFAGAGPQPGGDSVKTKDIGEYFASATGSEGRIDPLNGPSGAQPGYTFSSGGATIGANTPGSEDLVLGLALGYVGSSADVGSGEGSINSQSLRGGVFAARRFADLHGDAYLGTAFDSFSVTRNIAALGRDATSTPTGAEFDFAGHAAYDLHLGRATFSPSVGLSSDQLSIGPAKESGAGAMDLSVGQQNVYSLLSDTGAKVSYRLVGGRISLTPYVSAAYEHEFMNQSRTIDAQFSSGAGAPFTVNTADIARSGTLLAAGSSIDWRNGPSLRLEYSKDTRPNYDVNTLLVNLIARF